MRNCVDAVAVVVWLALVGIAAAQRERKPEGPNGPLDVVGIITLWPKNAPALPPPPHSSRDAPESDENDFDRREKCPEFGEWKNVSCWWPNQAFSDLPQECTYVPLPSKLPSVVQKLIRSKTQEMYDAIVFEYEERGKPAKCGHCSRSFRCRARNVTVDEEGFAEFGRGRRWPPREHCRAKEIEPVHEECNDPEPCVLSKERGRCSSPLFLDPARIGRIRALIDSQDHQEAANELHRARGPAGTDGAFRRRHRRQAGFGDDDVAESIPMSAPQFDSPRTAFASSGPNRADHPSQRRNTHRDGNEMHEQRPFGPPSNFENSQPMGSAFGGSSNQNQPKFGGSQFNAFPAFGTQHAEPRQSSQTLYGPSENFEGHQQVRQHPQTPFEPFSNFGSSQQMRQSSQTPYEPFNNYENSQQMRSSFGGPNRENQFESVGPQFNTFPAFGMHKSEMRQSPQIPFGPSEKFENNHRRGSPFDDSNSQNQFKPNFNTFPAFGRQESEMPQGPQNPFESFGRFENSHQLQPPFGDSNNPNSFESNSFGMRHSESRQHSQTPFEPFRNFENGQKMGSSFGGPEREHRFGPQFNTFPAFGTQKSESHQNQETPFGASSFPSFRFAMTRRHFRGFRAQSRITPSEEFRPHNMPIFSNQQNLLPFNVRAQPEATFDRRRRDRASRRFLFRLLHGTTCVASGEQCLCCCGPFVPDAETQSCQDLRKLLPGIVEVATKLTPAEVGPDDVHMPEDDDDDDDSENDDEHSEVPSMPLMPTLSQEADFPTEPFRRLAPSVHAKVPKPTPEFK